MKNQSMKNFWNGYRAAKSDDYECGFEYAVKEYSYGLNGQSDMFCKGYGYFIKRKREAIKARELNAR